jgi:hypothetical protein
MRGQYLLISPTAARAAAVTDIGDQLSVAAGRLAGGVPATAVLVRPDGHVAWASSQARPDPDELRELRSALTHRLEIYVVLALDWLESFRGPSKTAGARIVGRTARR